MEKKTPERNIITDKLVVAKTGKTMEEWFVLLDKKGAAKMSHKDIFDLVSSTKGLLPLGEWNHNLLTTSYEWNRGLKERGEKGKDFEISVSKTVNVPLNILYSYFNDERSRQKWLKEKNCDPQSNREQIGAHYLERSKNEPERRFLFKGH